MPWSGTEPEALVYWDDAPTNWATQPGPQSVYFKWSRLPSIVWGSPIWSVEGLQSKDRFPEKEEFLPPNYRIELLPEFSVFGLKTGTSALTPMSSCHSPRDLGLASHTYHVWWEVGISQWESAAGHWKVKRERGWAIYSLISLLVGCSRQMYFSVKVALSTAQVQYCFLPSSPPLPEMRWQCSPHTVLSPGHIPGVFSHCAHTFANSSFIKLSSITQFECSICFLLGPEWC